MPRAPRIEYEGAVYHVRNRGDRREPIFRGDRDRMRFLETVCEYVQLNPVRAKLFKPGQALRDYPWSSFPEYLKPPSHQWPWLRVERLLSEMRQPKDRAAGRREFERHMDMRRRQEGGDEQWAAIRRGWFFGAEESKQELLAQVVERVGAQHYGTERQESGEAKAERLVREELKKLRWREAELPKRRKGDPGKVRIARRWRQETTMTLA